MNKQCCRLIEKGKDMKKKEDARNIGNQNVNNRRTQRRGMKAGAALAALVVALGIGGVSASADQTTPSDGWVREDTSEGVVWYYYKDGEKQTGWIKDGIDWYYLNEDGSMKADEWFTDTDGNTYYFRSWGGMQYNAWGSRDGERYYFRSWGAAWNNGWHQMNGQWYYFSTDGTALRDTTEQLDRDIYSFDEEGRMLHDTWVTSGENLYYLRSWGGALNTGWNRLNGEWYYFDTETAAAWKSTTAQIGQDIYSFDEEGRMLHDTWVTSGENLYYLRSWGGALNTGWNRLDGEWYYFDSETAAARRNCMEFIDNDLYAFDDSGKMLHDQWGEYDGAPCYFRSWGGALDSGWHVIDGKTYYFYFHQCMTDAWVGGHYLDATGALVEDAEINYDLEAAPAVLVSWSDGWTKMSSDPAVVEEWKQKISALPVVEKSDSEDAYTGLGFTVTIREEDNSTTVYNYDYISQALTDGTTCYSLAEEALDQWFADMPGSRILVEDTVYTG